MKKPSFINIRKIIKLNEIKAHYLYINELMTTNATDIRHISHKHSSSLSMNNTKMRISDKVPKNGKNKSEYDFQMEPK